MNFIRLTLSALRIQVCRPSWTSERCVDAAFERRIEKLFARRK
jgi:hypothetical protein